MHFENNKNIDKKYSALKVSVVSINKNTGEIFEMQRKWTTFIAITIFSIAIAVGTVSAVGPNKTDKDLAKMQSEIEKRLNLLEFALVSQSPAEIAKTWAKGVMTRNGALQYAVLCDNLQSKYKSDFEAWDWWTRTSSPWIDSYQISAGEQQSDGTWKYIIKFQYVDSTKNNYSSISNIQISAKKVIEPPLPTHDAEQQWCIIRMETSQPLQKEQP